MIFTLSPLHAHRHVYLILFHFVHILALLLNLFILAFPIPFLSGMHYPLILPVTMWYSLKLYYVLTLFNLNCNSKALCSNHCILPFSTLPHLLFLFIYPGCTHTSFGYLYNPAHENGLHQKKKKRVHNILHNQNRMQIQICYITRPH